jgi:hypothetical protein
MYAGLPVTPDGFAIIRLSRPAAESGRSSKPAVEISH